MMASLSRLLGFIPFIPWTSTKRRKNTTEVKSSQAVSQECPDEGRPFLRLAETLNYAKSQEEFEVQIVTLIRLIWVASYTDFMTPRIVEAVRESIKVCKRTKFIGSAVEFYEFRVDGKILPAWIILHSPQWEDQSKTSTRHLLLQTYLDELPLTAATRDELYLACVEKGFNNFFDRIRLASLKELQARPETHETHMEIGHGSRLPVNFAEALSVVDTARGCSLNWFVPDMSKRLQSGLVFGRKFVAKGIVWGLYIRSQRGQVGPLDWDVVLCILKPSQNNLEGGVVATLDISLYVERKALNQGWIDGSVMYLDHVETLDLPVEGDMPRTRSLRCSFSSSTVDICRQYINKDGSCYLMLDLVILPPVTVKFHHKI